MRRLLTNYMNGTKLRGIIYTQCLQMTHIFYRELFVFVRLIRRFNARLAKLLLTDILSFRLSGTLALRFERKLRMVG